MNKLEDYFWNQQEKRHYQMHKWHHYFKVYDRHFAKFVGKKPKVLEIGVSFGGSIEMWDDYFGEGCEIYGVDIDPKCKELFNDKDNVTIFIGDQSDKNFWQEIKSQVSYFDIIIDDGGHTMKQQITSFECLFDYVSEDGVYLVEDVHTSYWPSHGGGLGNKGSFIEVAKNLIDHLNAQHWSNNPRAQRSGVPQDLYFRNVTNSMHFYDSIVVLEKGKNEPADHSVS